MTNNFDENFEKDKMLLNHALEKYKEEERRNYMIDNKNKNYIFITSLLFVVEGSNIFNLFYILDSSIVLMLISSLLCYVISLIYFILSLKYLPFYSTPTVGDCFKLQQSDYSFTRITATFIHNYKNVILDNDKLIAKKVQYSKVGVFCLVFGVCLFVFSVVLGYFYF